MSFGQPGSFPTLFTTKQLNDPLQGFPAATEAQYASSVAKFNQDFRDGEITSTQAAQVANDQFWPFLNLNAEVYGLSTGAGLAQATNTATISGFNAGETVTLNFTDVGGTVIPVAYEAVAADANGHGVAVSLAAAALLTPNIAAFISGATVALGVITFTAKRPGTEADGIALTGVSSANITVAVGNPTFQSGGEGATPHAVYSGTGGSTTRHYAVIPRYPLTPGSANNPGGAYLNFLPGAPPQGRGALQLQRTSWVGLLGPGLSVASTAAVLSGSNHVVITVPSAAFAPAANPPLQVITPAAMTHIIPGQQLTVGSGGGAETTTVLAVTATTFSAAFTKAHNAGVNVISPAVSTTVALAITGAPTAQWVIPAAMTNIVKGNQLTIGSDTFVVLAVSTTAFQAIIPSNHSAAASLADVGISTTTGATAVTAGLLVSNVVFDVVALNATRGVLYSVALGVAPGGTATDATGTGPAYSPFPNTEVAAGPSSGVAIYLPPISFIEGAI